ncbi:GDSL-type esterase/lipase family protein [Kitasatospora sp. NPDC097605]|uniref:golvesin C-terminal-like domain-containing protein n=1 Tax=Kitasatospora sp. NPDC097605 TaxID=3157226 RepID=UPI00331FCD42
MQRRNRAGTRTVPVLLSGLLATLLPLGVAPARAAAGAPEPAAVGAGAEAAPAVPAGPSEVAFAERNTVLGAAWASSEDRAWTTSSDAAGFQILVADQREGYAWRTAATLDEPGFDADQWIGNACVTGSGRYAVAVYAPRVFTNKPDLLNLGGFTAVVDLTSGAVTKLPVTASLAHFDPGCGADDTAVFTQGRDGGPGGEAGTRLIKVDAATGTLSAPIKLTGQVTSAVPLTDGWIAAADSNRVVAVGQDGSRSTLAVTASVPYYLTPRGDGGVAFLDRKGAEDARAEVVTGDALRGRKGAAPVTPHTVAEGKRTELGLSQGGGRVYVVGKPTGVQAALPDGVGVVDGVPNHAEVSTTGQAVVTRTEWADGRTPTEGAAAAAPTASAAPAVNGGDGADGVEGPGGVEDPAAPGPTEPVASTVAGADPLAARPADIALKVLTTGKELAFTVDPSARVSPKADEGSLPSPALKEKAAPGAAAPAPAPAPAPGLTATTTTTTAGSPTDPVEAERTCAVPRNDPRNQALQPKPRQVEWAVNQAVKETLNQNTSRPANWKNLGMPAYQPQSLVPRVGLTGGGRVPAQILLGIASQESNLWQAARAAVPGVTANPLIGNFYGLALYDGDPANDWTIDWAKSDCGYGVMQVTDHMRLAGRENGAPAAYDYNVQRAIALDYTANIAVGQNIIEEKWNQLKAVGMTVNNGDPAKLENWFMALWAYNTGFNPSVVDGEPWGVGWVNNPANPNWDAGRASFLEFSGADAAHPQDWPYPEKVLGFAGRGFSALEAPNTMVASFRPATWNGFDDPNLTYAEGTATYNRKTVKPPEDLFCQVLVNVCNPIRISDTSSNDTASTGPCGRVDFKCWWNKPVTWKPNCAQTCGNEFIRFNSTYKEEADGTAYPPNCSTTASASGNALPPGALVIDDTPDNVPSVRPNCGASWSNAGSFTMSFAQDSHNAYASKIDLHQLGAGFGGHFSFSHSRAANIRGGIHEITGTWALNQPQSGVWNRVLVHLPDHGAQTQQARYAIDTGSGYFTKNRTINQKRLANRWVSLGVFEINGTGRVRLSSVTEDGTGDEDIAWDAVAFQPLPAKPKDIVVQMGDSYISGQGSGPYEAGTDVGPKPELYTQSSSGRSWNACRRSQNSYVRKSALPGGTEKLGSRIDRLDPTLDFQNVSCSGAFADGITTGARGWGRIGQHHEVTQIGSGVLDDSTTLVVLSIGGNDAGFSDAVMGCINPLPFFGGCPEDSYQRGLINGMRDRTTAVLNAIKLKAPHAKIVLMSYPSLFTPSPDRTCALVLPGARATLNSWAAYLQEQEGVAVAASTAASSTTYYVPATQFDDHRLCDDESGINGIVAANGDGDFSCPNLPSCPSMESFHPNNRGTDLYALALQQALVNAQYGQ